MAIRKKFLLEGESIYTTMRTHAKKMIGPFLLAIVLVAAVVTSIVMIDNTVLVWLIIIVAVILAILCVLWPWLNWMNTTYTITNLRVVTRTGVFTKNARDISLSRISSVSLEKQISDRIFGCGTLVIADASEKEGLRMNDIPHVEQVQHQLQQFLVDRDNGSAGVKSNVR
ncbi:MAG: PH domain-containing protein [Cellulomonadaceae bacterium]|jgi:uncharacterized membrane protein YdbT with pleckstrin-like domain|nr:PH domain-containing protein [Cellulomonadaceae bacterium]